MRQIKTVDEVWQQIQFAEQHGAKVINSKGEMVKIVPNTGDEVKCYTSFPCYYLSTANKQTGLLFDGKPYDQWREEKVFEVE
jgi:hypothetical protein